LSPNHYTSTYYDLKEKYYRSGEQLKFYTVGDFDFS
jgi:hypothetical protein